MTGSLMCFREISFSNSHMLALWSLLVIFAGFHTVLCRRLPPAIIRQPAAEVLFLEEEPFRLECEASGDPQPTYVWYKNGEEFSVDAKKIEKEYESGSLEFVDPDKTDEGKYQCRAQNSFGIAVSRDSSVKRAELDSFPEEEERTVISEEGAPLSLHCSAPFGVPEPEIDWIVRSDGITFRDVDSARTAVDPGGGLHFSGVRREDARPGTVYACTARSPRLRRKTLGGRVSLNLSSVAATYPITEQFVSLSTVALEGDALELVCIFGGTPPPEISWVKEGSSVRGRRVSFRNHGRTLRIAGLQSADAGDYECIASNGVHSPVTALVPVVIQVRPFWTEAAQDSFGAEGSNISFVCAADGTPPPEVEWSVNGTPLKDSDERMGGNATFRTLTLENLKQKDVGVHQCRATNVHGSILHNFYLDVLMDDDSATTEERVVQDAGQPAQLSCPQESETTAVWLRGGRVLETGPRRLETATPGVYECLLESRDRRWIAKRIHLVVRDVPSAPLLSGVQCNGSVAMLRWAAGDDGGAPLLGYEVQVRTDFAPDDWQSVRTDISDTSYAAPLSPWATSSFRVRARNAVGAGPPSAHSAPCASPEDVPSRNPEQVRGRGTSQHNLVISWSPMPPVEQNAPGFFYRVYWRREDGPWESEDVRDWERGELMVTDQPSFRQYLIRVEARNSKGPALVPAPQVVGYSGENVPLESPQNLSCVSVLDSRTAVLSWLPVSPQSVRGHFKGYKVQAWLEGEDEESLWESVVRPNVSESTVQMFRPAATHRVRILAFNDKYDGPPSDVIAVTTPEGTPGSVESFEAFALGSSAIYLRWRPPLQTNGVLTGYRLYFAKTEGAALGLVEELRPIVADPQQLSALLGDLSPDATYRVSVRAQTAVGEGQSYFLEPRTGGLPQTVPDEPDFSYEWLANKTGVKVTWTPDVTGNSGSSFLAQYRKQGEDEWLNRHPVQHADFVRILGLEPNSTYEVRLVAADAGLSTTGSTVQLAQDLFEDGLGRDEQEDD